MTRRKLQGSEGIAALPIIIIVIALAVLAGGYVMMKKAPAPQMAKQDTKLSAASGATGEMMAPSTAPAKQTFTVSETTDTQLNADENALDTKLNAANSDAANIDSGLNDKQGNLSEQ